MLAGKINAVACRRCGSAGKWIRAKIDSGSGSWIWCCGGLSRERDGQTVSQGTLFAYALGIDDVRNFKKRLPKEILKRIGGVKVRVVVPLQRTPKRQITEEYLSMRRGVSEAERIDEDKDKPPSERTWIEKLKAVMTLGIEMIEMATTPEQYKGAARISSSARSSLTMWK